MINKEELDLLEQTKFNYVLSDNLRQAIQNILKDYKDLHLAYEYYKERHLEFNNGIIESMNTEAMLKDLEKRYEVYGKRK